MTFNEIHKTCRNLQRKGRERKKQREVLRVRNRKKAAPPATKLTASRLDIWPLVIREVPDFVPLNLSSKSLFSTVLTPQCLTRLSPAMSPSPPPPPCFSPVNIAAKITLQFCACLPLNCLPSKHNLLWQYIRWYVSYQRQWVGSEDAERRSVKKKGSSKTRR